MRFHPFDRANICANNTVSGGAWAWASRAALSRLGEADLLQPASVVAALDAARPAAAAARKAAALARETDKAYAAACGRVAAGDSRLA